MHVIFDFGGVLGLPQDLDGLDGIAPLVGLERDELRRRYQAGRPGLDRGTVGLEEYWRGIFAAGSVRPTPEQLAQAQRADVLSWTRINAPMIAWADAVRAAGHTTSILSNMPTDILAWMRGSRSFDWIGKFPVAVFSCDVGLIKPDPAIYELCLKRLGARPSDSLFIDDMPPNVEAARALGMAAIHFRSTPQVVREAAERWGLPSA
jgi:putative hydrolase of the HAD superfamily